MHLTWYIPFLTFLTALIPLLVGFVWYNPKVFGNAWMKAADMSPEKAQGANMPLIFGLTYLFSLMTCVILATASIHQFHIYSIFSGNPDFRTEGSETQMMLADFMSKYGTNFRTFRHGLFHGILLGFVAALPIIGINALFERKGFKYIAINAGFFIVSFGLMGGVICAFL
jgi:hypothetical protein